MFSTNALVALAAHAVPLEWAPWITTYGALGIQLVPLLIVVFGTSAVFPGFARRALSCGILLLAPSHVAEVWLTTLHSQVHWGMAAVLILLEDLAGAGRARRWMYRGVLAIAALSSVYVSFLLPAFLLRAWTQRRERRVHLAIVGAAFVVQAAVALTCASAGTLNTKRFSPVTIGSIVFAAERQIAYPLLGHDLTRALARSSGSHVVGLAVLALAAAAILAALACRARLRLTADDPRTVLLLSFACVFSGTCITAFGGMAGGRYAVVSGAVLLLACLAFVPRTCRRWPAWIPLMLLACALGAGAREYRLDPDLRCDGSTTCWRTEVARWRADPYHPIPLCPAPWVLRLTPRARSLRP
ncbi:MAG: hypothetical protein U1E76_18630 [Planctomycetota bacterium]